MDHRPDLPGGPFVRFLVKEWTPVSGLAQARSPWDQALILSSPPGIL
jgi:hypothetical protein